MTPVYFHDRKKLLMQPLHMCRLKGFVAYPGEKKRCQTVARMTKQTEPLSKIYPHKPALLLERNLRPRRPKFLPPSDLPFDG